MEELIGKTIDEILGSELYETYFSSLPMEQSGDDWYISNDQLGIEAVLSPEKVIRSIHLFSGKKDSIPRFEGRLPNNLLFSDPYEVWNTKMQGIKFESGEAKVLPILGKINPWKKYFFKTGSVRVEYSDEGEIVLITLSQ